MFKKEKIKEVVRDYSEYSTIAGLIYIFMRDQKVLGIIFWTLVVVGLSILGLVWSVMAYNDWDSQPVITTAVTTGLPIQSVEFPSVILCAQGVIDNVMIAGLLRQYYDYYKKRSSKFCSDLSPYDAAVVLTKMNKTDMENVIAKQMMSCLTEKWVEFINESFPGMTRPGTGSNTQPDPMTFVLLSYFQKSLQIDKRAQMETVVTSNIPVINFLMNSGAAGSLESIKQNFTNQLRDTYTSLSAPQVFFTIFRTLWYTSLPCFDVIGMTSTGNQRTSFLKQCKWRGTEISCSALFSTFPTDQGMCCTFNMANADQIFSDSAYSKIIVEMQLRDDVEALESIPGNISTDNLLADEGANLGLEVVLDGHTNLLSPFSVESDFSGFSGLIIAKNNFPLVNHKGFLIEPGRKNSIALNAIGINADDDIRPIQAQKRNCLFKDENTGLTLFKQYSQANCFLECSLKNAIEIVSRTLPNQLNGTTNSTTKCTPWSLPFSKNYTMRMCTPFENLEITQIMRKTKLNEVCQQCLPDCRRVIYQQKISTAPFRKCDVKNFGMSAFCSLNEVRYSSSPQIWAQTVLAVSPNNNFESNIRNVSSNDYTGSQFDFLNRKYDAFNEDIAVVNIFFDTSSVMEFGTKQRLGWVDFISNVGGLLGLCLGLSIVTVIELLWLFLKLGKVCLKPISKVQPKI